MSTGHSRGMPCVFGDVLDQVVGLPATEEFQSKPFKERKELVDKCALAFDQWCYTHAKHCSILRPSDLDVSGLPCPDMSKANNKRRYQEGPTAGVYCVWAKKHRHLRTPLLLVENVPVPRLQCFFGCSLNSTLNSTLSSLQ